MTRLLFSTLTSKKMIRHCDREARSGKQSAALLESKTVQITSKCGKLHPFLSTLTSKKMIRHCDPPVGGEAICWAS